MKTCPDQPTILAFLHGNLDATAIMAVDQHLSSCDACDRLLQKIAREDTSKSLRLSETAPELSLVDDVHDDDRSTWPRFEDLRLRKVIGRGGNGRVYLAEQRSVGHRAVAVKVLHSCRLSGDEKNRLQEEITALTGLEHDYIARIYQTSVSNDGRLGIVMDHIDGCTLSQYVTDKNIDLKQRLDLAERIGEAVGAIHDNDLVHRDLSARNIMILERDGELIPKIIDFGLALRANRKLPDQWTRVGTRRYMPPEQAGRSSEGISRASDVYALGICIYELVTGQHAVAQSQDENTEAYFDRKYEPDFRLPELEGIVRPSEGLSKGQLVDLRIVLEKATNIQPSRRYQHAKQLIDDLAALRTYDPISARQNDRRYTASLFARRNRVSLLVGGTVAMSLVVAYGMVFRSGLVVREQTSRANQVVTESSDILKTLLAENNPTMTSDPKTKTASETSDFSRAVERELGNRSIGDSDAFLKTRLAAANAQLNVGDWKGAMESLHHIIHDCEERFGRDADDTVTLRTVLAKAHLMGGQFESARKIYDEARETWVDRYGKSDSRILAIDFYQASLDYHANQFDSAIQQCETLEANLQRSTDKETMLLSEIKLLKSHALTASGQFELAEESLLIARQLMVASGIHLDHAKFLELENDLAVLESRRGNGDLAIKKMRSILRRTEVVYPAGSRATDLARYNLATMLLRFGQADEGHQLLQETISASEYSGIRELAIEQLQSASK